MLLRTVYTVTPDGPGPGQIALPLNLALGDGIHASLAKHHTTLRLVVDRLVDASRLEIVEESGWFRELSTGEREPLPRLRLDADDPPERVVVEDLLSAVTFLTDTPLALSHLIEDDRFVPEDEEEEQLLARLGTDEPYHETGARLALRTFSARVDEGAIRALLPRSAGVRLYSDAVKLPLEVAQFRELWRVLESAFARSDDELVKLLTSYPPAQQLAFDDAELQDLLVLRGRASHAQSKAGVLELIAVERDCGKRLGRLKSLVERVIVTKEHWSYPTVGVEELAPLQAYVGPHGEPVIRRTRGA